MYARRPIWKRSKKTDSDRMVGIVGMKSSRVREYTFTQQYMATALITERFFSLLLYLISS